MQTLLRIVLTLTTLNVFSAAGIEKVQSKSILFINGGLLAIFNQLLYPFTTNQYNDENKYIFNSDMNQIL